MKNLFLTVALIALTACSTDDKPTNYNLKSGNECFTEDCKNQAELFVIDERKQPLGNVTITIVWVGGPMCTGCYYEGQGYDSKGNWYHFWTEYTYGGAPFQVMTMTLKARLLPNGPTYPGHK